MLQMEVCDDLGVDLHFTSSSVDVMEAEEVRGVQQQNDDVG